MTKQFLLDFNMDNAAFEDAPATEAARILRDVIAKLQSGHTDGTIMDINGNRIGDWAIEDND